MCLNAPPRTAWMKNTLLKAAAAIAMAWPGQAAAQNWIQNWISYSMADGLSDDHIAAIIEDDHGKIWVGTGLGGLNQFDGRDWTFYSRARGDSIASDFITAMMKDREGHLWIGTYDGGVSKIDPDDDLKNPSSWKNYNRANTQGGLLNNYITAIVEDDSGNVWFGTPIGISVFAPKSSLGQDPLRDRNNWTILTPDSQLVTPDIFALEKDSAGKIWAGTVGGAYRYEPRTFKTTRRWDLRLDLGHVMAIFADSYGYVWFGRFINSATESGVARVLATNPIAPVKFSLANYTVAIGEDRDGKIWFGTADRDHGVFVVDPNADLTKAENWFEFTQKDGLAENGISSILPDSEGDMWVGTAEKGISRFDISWINFSETVGLDFANVLAMIEDDSGKLWLGTDGKGLRLVNRQANLFLGKNWHIITRTDKALSSNQINAIFKDSNGKFWVASSPDTFDARDNKPVYHGLNAVNPLSNLNDPVNWDHFLAEDSLLPDNTVNAIAQDHLGYLWFGTNNGLSRVHANDTKIKAGWMAFDTSDGLASNSIQSLFFDNKKRLWIGATAGLNWIDLNASTTIKFESLPAIKNAVQTIYQDLEGNLWFGTESNGAYKLDLSNVLRGYTTTHGLASNSVRSIVQQRSNEYWFGTGSGLTRLRVSPFGGRTDSLWTRFKAKDGPGAISIWAAHKDKKGDLWFGAGGRGVTRHRLKKTPPETFITSKLDITTVENVIVQFKGVDRSASSTGMLRYSYRYDDTNWSPFLASEEVAIAGLSDGRHVFEVRAADRDGNIDPTPATEVFYKINARLGGRVEIQDSRGWVALYLPPENGETFQEAKIIRVENYVLKDSLAILAYDLLPDTLKLGRPATLTIAFKDTLRYRQNKLAIFRQDKNSDWHKIGGTVMLVDDTLKLATAINEFGRYAARKDKTLGMKGAAVVDTVTIQPRIFSPSGGGQGHGDRASISFYLSHEATATIKIYNIAGRLKRTVQENFSFQAGRNAIEWDGKDDDGKFCVSGLYIVAIHASGQVKTKTVAVLNKYE